MQNEQKLREVIRESIKVYSLKKNKLSLKALEEKKVRKAIRNLLSEVEKNDFVEPVSTLANDLDSFFNDSGIYETIRKTFYGLGGHPDDPNSRLDEKLGFIEAFLEKTNEVCLMSSDNQKQNKIELEEQEDEQQDEEEESPELNILNNWGARVPSVVSKEQEKLKKDKEKEKEISKSEETQEINKEKTYKDRGYERGSTIFEQRVKNEIKKLMSDRIGGEREEARTSIMQNYAAWFDMWTRNSEENITDFLIQQLNRWQVEVPEQVSSKTVGVDQTDVTTEPVVDQELDASQAESAPADEDESIQEDFSLFELLDQDLK